MIALIVYVDDIVVTRNDNIEITNLKNKLAGEYEIKDLGNLKYFLGIEIFLIQERDLHLTTKHVLDLLPETSLIGWSHVTHLLTQIIDLVRVRMTISLMWRDIKDWLDVSHISISNKTKHNHYQPIYACSCYSALKSYP